MSSHPAPAAIAALADLVRLAAPPGVQVDDGEPVADLDVPDAIGIGIDVGDVASASATVEYAAASEQQPFDVACLVQSASGDTDLATVRARAFELLDVVGAVLAASPDLGLPGVVWDARIPGWSLRSVRLREKGVLAVIEFPVRINAYRQ